MGIAKATLSALLYIGVLQSAISMSAHATDYTSVIEARDGDMRKLLFSTEPVETSNSVFTHKDGTETSIADFAGKVVVLNFWATWCAPCRKEMPSLSELRAKLGGENFDVVPVATGPKNEPQKIAKFFEDNEIGELPVYLDADSRFANEMGIRGLPITVILNGQGQEIARLRGDADWASDNAIDLMQRVIELEAKAH